MKNKLPGQGEIKNSRVSFGLRCHRNNEEWIFSVSLYPLCNAVSVRPLSIPQSFPIKASLFFSTLHDPIATVEHMGKSFFWFITVYIVLLKVLKI